MNIHVSSEQLARQELAIAIVKKEGQWSGWGQGYRICRSAIQTFATMTFDPDRFCTAAQPGLLMGFLEGMRPHIPEIAALGTATLLGFTRIEFPQPVHPEECICMQERCDMAMPEPEFVLEVEHRVWNVTIKQWAMFARARWRYDI